MARKEEVRINNKHRYYIHYTLESFRATTVVSQRIEAAWGGIGWDDFSVHLYNAKD